VNIRNDNIGWIGKVLPGQSLQSVLKYANQLPKPQKQGNKLIWTMKGDKKTVTGTTTESWSATLTFNKKKLTMIDIN
jgi:hypothetical protein